MQLKEIILQGFKSFADRTVIKVEPGITTIVGPNGSGKSNISDSIRWVLGEQSIKSLRGSNMQDVIFAGTEARKSQGMAEVTLILDNTDKSLPVEFNEVSITRRIYRSGESEYYINKALVRLKDVLELFMDTGVGKDGYSIIGQGKIDSIISSKSDERRNIFEEASGIVKYRTRKEEAIRKLDNTNLNLERLEDILYEIKNNLEPLEQKSIAAKKYLELKNNIKNIDVKLFVDLIENTSTDLGKLNLEIEDLNESIRLSEEKIEGIKRNSNENRVELEELLQELQTNQDEYYKLSSEMERLTSRIDSFEDRMTDAKNSCINLKNEIESNKVSITALEEELVARTNKKSTMEQNKDRFVIELTQKEEELAAMLSNMTDKELEIEKLKQDLEQVKDNISECKVNISSGEAKISEQALRIEKIDKSFEISSNEHTSLNEELENSKHEYNICKEQKEKAQQKIEKLENEKQNLDKYFGNLEEKKATLKQNILEAKSKLSYITNLENENAGYILSVKSVMDLAKRNLSYENKVFGTLASIITTDEKYEQAIEVALGGYLQNIVVDTDRTAKDLIAFLKEGMLGRATFLPLDGIRLYKDEMPLKAKQMTGYIGAAIELVKFKKEFEKVVKLALGRIIIVDNIDSGTKIAKVTDGTVKIVTLSGEVIATTGSITGGQANVKQMNFVGRSRKKEEYQKALANAEKEYAEFENSLKDKQEKQSSLNIELDVLKQEFNKINLEYALKSEKLSQKIREIDKQKSNILDKEDEKKSLLDSIQNLKQNNEVSVKKLEELNNKMLELQEEINEYTRFNKEKETKINYLKEDIMNLKISVSSFDETSLSIDEMIEKINQDIAGFYDAIEKKNILIKEYELKLSNGEKQNTDEKIKVDSLQQDVQNKKDIIEKLNIAKAENVLRQGNFENEMMDIVKVLDKLKQEKVKVESKKSKYDEEFEMQKVKLWEEYELTPNNAKEYAKTIIDLDGDTKAKLEQKLNKYKNEIKALGDVSVSAIEEYKELKERYVYISSQKEDAASTKEKLQSLIDNTTNIMKTQFSKQFKLINENFKEVFSELFGGGRAELKLTDESNVLESGIEIIAEPPGKKLQNLSLLSGGEKALIAIAILFSILKLKSPPFCILDEIEAALDDVNVARFARYLKDYSDDTQFLVITHRKGTMEIASSVYGVTMQEYGISKLVSMKIK